MCDIHFFFFFVCKKKRCCRAAVPPCQGNDRFRNSGPFREVSYIVPLLLVPDLFFLRSSGCLEPHLRRHQSPRDWGQVTPAPPYPKHKERAGRSTTCKPSSTKRG